MSESNYARITSARSIAAFERGMGNDGLADLIVDLTNALEEATCTHD